MKSPETQATQDIMHKPKKNKPTTKKNKQTNKAN